MRRTISIMMAVILCTVLFTGCGKKLKVDTDTVYVLKKGAVISVDVEDFDKDYYDEAELETYIDEQVKDYTEKNGKTVSVESYKVEDGKAKLNLKYDGYASYSDFTGTEFYAGTLIKAQAEGYGFDTDFVEVKEQKKGNAISVSDVLENDGYKVAIIKADIDVKVDGTVHYVSKDNTEVTAKDTVAVKSGNSEEEAAPTYIIYK